ncbi:MAG TPA: M24 family metallopeptidase [Vicinamibacterales bacterium]|nr:M24 family metallopeptidase [Vicinamibacterales bacterium]
MSPDIAAIQQSLALEHLDGWLLYDFHGSNPIARKMVGLSGGTMTSRRWYYFIPAAGAPRKLVHAIEPHVLDGVPGEKASYAGRRQLEERLAALVAGARVVAMEYSPECAIPYLSRIDAGTVEWLRRLGLTITSSGDLVGRFEAAWDAAAIATHRAASERLYRIKDRTFEFVGAKLAAGDAPTEYAVQQQMLAWFEDEGLVTDHGPIVGAGEHSGDPHFAPSEHDPRLIRPNEVLLLDLWGKLTEPGAVYADITWTGFTGEPTAEVAGRFAAAVAGRDAAVAKVQTAVAAGTPLHGWEVDRACRDVIEAAGFGDLFIHRTGHSLGEEVHGNGVHMDDYETHDDRRLLPGTGFTIEPGIYSAAFGVRTEINMVVGDGTAEVTGPRQQVLVPILTPATR